VYAKSKICASMLRGDMNDAAKLSRNLSRVNTGFGQ